MEFRCLWQIFIQNGPIWPLLPEKPTEIGVRIINERRKNVGEDGAGIRQDNEKTEADEMQLPIERMGGMSVIVGAPQMNIEGQQTCAFCEYLLHYLQQVITNPSTEVCEMQCLISTKFSQT